MTVSWTEIMPLHKIPEMYWGEDLTLLDRQYNGEVIGTTKGFWGTTYLVVSCSDGNIREVEIEEAKIIIN